MSNETMPNTFCVELNPKQMTDKDWDSFQEAMDKVAEETNRAIAQLAYDLGVDEGCARDVWYLRTRSRHTPELESELIKLHKAGTPPNMCDFGHPVKSSAA